MDQSQLEQEIIDNMTKLLKATEARLEEVEKEYNELHDKVLNYRESLRKLNGGSVPASGNGTERAPRSSGALKEHIIAAFEATPGVPLSPKEVTDWLERHRGWTQDNLRQKVSNLLRKSFKDGEAWINRPKHGKYELANTGVRRRTPGA